MVLTAAFTPLRNIPIVEAFNVRIEEIHPIFPDTQRTRHCGRHGPSYGRCRLPVALPIVRAINETGDTGFVVLDHKGDAFASTAALIDDQAGGTNVDGEATSYVAGSSSRIPQFLDSYTRG